MLTKCLFESNAEPVTWYGQIVGIASRGYRQTLALTGAVVECRGEAVIANVSIHLSVNERGRGSIAFRFTDAPRALRDSLREAAERYPSGTLPSGTVRPVLDRGRRPLRRTGAPLAGDRQRWRRSGVGHAVRGGAAGLVPWPVKEK
jgi:hypothetical protein